MTFTEQQQQQTRSEWTEPDIGVEVRALARATRRLVRTGGGTAREVGNLIERIDRLKARVANQQPLGRWLDSLMDEVLRA